MYRRIALAASCDAALAPGACSKSNSSARRRAPLLTASKIARAAVGVAMFVSVAGFARVASADVFSGRIAATGNVTRVVNARPDMRCSWAVTITVDAEIRLNNEDGTVVARLTGRQDWDTSDETCLDISFDYDADLTAESLSDLASQPVTGLWAIAVGPVYLSLAEAEDSLTGSFAGSIPPNTSYDGATFNGSVTGSGSLARRSCYDVGSQRTLDGHAGSFDITTPTDCGCSVSGVPSFVTARAPVTASGKTRHAFQFEANPESVTPRRFAMTLTCGTETVSLKFVQAPASGFRGRFLIRTKPAVLGVRGEQ